MQTLKQAHEDALIACKNATESHLKTHGEKYYCGFAWVEYSVSRTNSLEAKTLLQLGYTKSHKPKTLTLWNPSGHGTQCMETKSAGARAYADFM